MNCSGSWAVHHRSGNPGARAQNIKSGGLKPISRSQLRNRRDQKERRGSEVVLRFWEVSKRESSTADQRDGQGSCDSRNGSRAADKSANRENRCERISGESILDFLCLPFFRCTMRCKTSGTTKLVCARVQGELLPPACSQRLERFERLRTSPFLSRSGDL